MDKYDVIGIDGRILTRLNQRLAERQNVSDKQLEALQLSHQLRWMLFETAKQQTDPLKLRLLANVFESLESEQQKLWNFDVNKDFHRFFDFPGCTCPKMDNAERIGTPYHIYSANCPIHTHRIQS